MILVKEAKKNLRGVTDGVIHIHFVSQMKKSIGDGVGGAPTQGAEAFWTFTIVIVLIGARVSLATPSFIRFKKKQKRGGQRKPPFPFLQKTDKRGGPSLHFLKKMDKYNLNQHRFSFENLKPMQNPKKFL